MDTACSLEELVELSARIGRDTFLVQAGGGNTSLKIDGTLWVKASGKWLVRAAEEDMFLPVPLPDILADVAANREYAGEFVTRNRVSLRPSVETAMHAVLPQAVVLHVHSVQAIAWAVRRDAEIMLTQQLSGLNWAWIPYIHPGLQLARSIQQALASKPSVLMLGNHGLVVTGDDCSSAESLLQEVQARLQQSARNSPEPDLAGLETMAKGTSWRMPEDKEVHALGTDRFSSRIVAEGTLFPDHCVYVGPAMAIAADGESLTQAAERYTQSYGLEPTAMVVRGKGTLVSKSLSRGGRELMLCLKRIAEQIPIDAPVDYLQDSDVAKLINWDAEKYRLAMAREHDLDQPTSLELE